MQKNMFSPKTFLFNGITNMLSGNLGNLQKYFMASWDMGMTPPGFYGTDPTQSNLYLSTQVAWTWTWI